MWYTNWVDTFDGNASTYNPPATPSNDGEWHTYRFEWRTDEIKWFVDDVPMHTETQHIPYYAARFWVGVWFPDSWCGSPAFEKDYMLVDYVN